MSEEIKYPCEQIALNFLNKMYNGHADVLNQSIKFLLKKEIREAYLAGREDALKEKINNKLNGLEVKSNPKMPDNEVRFIDKKGDVILKIENIKKEPALKNEFFKNEGFSNE